MFRFLSALQSFSKHFLDDSVSVAFLISSMIWWPPNNPQGSRWNSVFPRFAYNSLQGGLDACVHTHLAMPCHLCQPHLGAARWPKYTSLLYALEVAMKKNNKKRSAPAVGTQLCTGWSRYLRQSTGIALSDPTIPNTVLKCG